MSDAHAHEDQHCHAAGGGCGCRQEPLDLEAVRRRLAEKSGAEYWRSLEELAEAPAFAEMLQREFPRQAAEWVEASEGEAGGVSRRRFLQLSSASLALAGLTACTRQPLEKIVPYVKQPEEILPGRPLFYASAATHLGYAAGVLVESNMGRPTKIEGNPEHPESRGATDALTQASLLTLYDPDRSAAIHYLDTVRTWSQFLEAIQPALNAQKAIGGAGLRIVTGATTSPSLAYGLRRLLATYPQARWQRWEPAGRDAVREGTRLAFGQAAEVRYDLTKADVVVALDSDFLTQGPGAIRYAREFADRRRLEGEAADMNRLYAFESGPTATGTMADHRVALRPSDIARVGLALAQAIGVPGVSGSAPERAARIVAAAARDLQAHRGRGLVVAGEQAPAELHALAHAMNATLGNLGATVLVSDPVDFAPADAPSDLASLTTLTDELRAGKVDLLILLGVNPVFDAPADLDWKSAIQKARLRVHLGLYFDETAEYCQWHVPQAHYLETWGDARALDGTTTIQQPLIEPLYDGKTPLELVAALAGQPGAAHDLLKAFWQMPSDGSREAQARGAVGGALAFQDAWRKALHDGQVEGSSLPVKAVSIDGAAIGRAAATLAASRQIGRIELAFRPDPAIFDGRHANNAWMQELARPLTKLTWDNALILAPKTAQELAVRHEQVVELQVAGHSVRVPVWVQPGQAEGAGTLHLGYGRRKAGRVGTGVGVDVYPLRRSDGLWTAGAEVVPTAATYSLASTQLHFNIPLETEEAKKRELLRVGTLAEYRAKPEFAKEMGEVPPPDMTMYPAWKYEGYAWGLVVDLNACTGCNACVIACQSENNIPVVGKEQVAVSREMHWIRIDRYFRGDLDDPQVYHQPVMCQQCEMAPCETVCPVAATSHSSEGLNDMVYNRCVGTRYCSNNCPYKVRRFNFFNYNKTEPQDHEAHPVLKLLHNPDVTVRFRGVMEKCTYCVQRINRAKIAAEEADRKVRDGDIVTACAQACPSQAIVFGDINDKQSRVARLKAGPRNYGILEELNTRPRTTYLARLRNPNPELLGPEKA
ncbi:MAG: TAT-variant-translocated molybdopterin oxidoreductase [Acidobacteriota bacterium]